MDTKNKDKFNFEIKVLLSLAALLLIAIFYVSVADLNRINLIPQITLPGIITGTTAPGTVAEIKNFSSEEDFKQYLESSAKISGGYGGGLISTPILPEGMPVPGTITKNAADSGAPADRVSQTNVQVIGIDEPDIVKTDGKEIYFSGTQRYYYGPMMKGAIPPNDNSSSGITYEEQTRIATPGMMLPIYRPPIEKTNIVKAFPPADLALDGTIDKQGDLLLDNNILVVFPTQGYYYGNSKQEITAYNVSNPKSPAKKWSMNLGDNTSIVTSRMKDGKIYLITKNTINQNRPCPIKPLSLGGSEISIPCGEIYHPVMPVPVDTTFVASLIDPATGKVEKNVSFVGASYSGWFGTTVIYVSENAIYATYTYNESQVKFITGFIKENSELFPASLVSKIVKLNSYDISESSKMSEFSLLIEKYESSLESDERLKLDTELQNRMNNYYMVHSRELEKTGIVKINTDTFKIIAHGEVPGHLLNNFAMDEYKENLRVASTTSNIGGLIASSLNQSFSDVYVLDKNLDTIGSVKGLGKTEQIYSVRFVEDNAYVVTFRQTDPFYILDLSDPKHPTLTGELKIPGYSSYLHPLDATHILGIGQEGSQVKISLFNVSDKSNPMELDKYLLDEYWSEVSNNYHAFLLDKKHNIFFLPGSKGGYVFSYNPGFISDSENTWLCQNRNLDEQTNTNVIDTCKNYLKLEKAVSQNSVKRAIYLNDYLYIIGDDKIAVLNEINWTRVNELDLQQ